MAVRGAHCRLAPWRGACGPVVEEQACAWHLPNDRVDRFVVRMLEGCHIAASRLLATSLTACGQWCREQAKMAEQCQDYSRAEAWELLGLRSDGYADSAGRHIMDHRARRFRLKLWD